MLKDLKPLKKCAKNEEASYNFRLVFALSNRAHFHGVYLVTVRFHLILSVFERMDKYMYRQILLLNSNVEKNLPPRQSRLKGSQGEWRGAGSHLHCHLGYQQMPLDDSATPQKCDFVRFQKSLGTVRGGSNYCRRTGFFKTTKQ